jgi:hypothetical protein
MLRLGASALIHALASSLAITDFISSSPAPARRGRRYMRRYGPAVHIAPKKSEPNSRAKRRNAYFIRPAHGNRKSFNHMGRAA